VQDRGEALHGKSGSIAGPVFGGARRGCGGTAGSWRWCCRYIQARLAWVLARALVPWLNLAVILASGAVEWGQTAVPAAETLNRAAVTFAVLLSLRGAARLTGELPALQRALAKVVEQGQPDVVRRLFHRIDSTLVPVLLTAATVIILPVDEAVAREPVAALIHATTWLLLGIPLSTAVWVYLMLQVGLTRLGRGQLTVEAYLGDRSLGLRCSVLLPTMIGARQGRLTVTRFSMPEPPYRPAVIGRSV
jgi:hypothetical protein